MRTYLILKEKARQWNADSEIQALLTEVGAGDQAPIVYGRESAAALKAREFDRVAIGARGMPYEQLDQLTVELLLGAR
jgi:xylose isomerase